MEQNKTKCMGLMKTEDAVVYVRMDVLALVIFRKSRANVCGLRLKWKDVFVERYVQD